MKIPEEAPALAADGLIGGAAGSAPGAPIPFAATATRAAAFGAVLAGGALTV